MDRLKRIGGAVILLFILCPIAAWAQSAPDLNGRWEAEGVTAGPWIFDLAVSGNVVTGYIAQHSGVFGPSKIFDGKVEGNTVTFKARNPIITPAIKEITFTGRIFETEIAFERSVEIILTGPNDNVLSNEAGVFGAQGVPRFTVRRAGPVPKPGVALVPSALPVDVTGRWESLRWNLDIWRFDLQSRAGQLTGTVSMTAGPNRQALVNPTPAPIFDGKIEGNSVTFKVKSHDNLRTISLSGNVQGDEFAVTRSVEVPGSGAPGFEAIFGAMAPMMFVAKRVRPAPAAAPGPMADLQRALQKWGIRPFKDYEFTAQWQCLCPLPTLPLVYRVSGETGVVQMSPNLGGSLGLPPEAIRNTLERYSTIEKIFAYLREAAARQPHLLNVTYHPELGYPVAVDLQPAGLGIYDNVQMRIIGLRPLEAVAAPRGRGAGGQP